VIDKNNEPMYKLRIDTLKNRKIEKINLDKNLSGNESPPYPYRNNQETPWNEMD
jgi:hypothetical protein